MAAFILVLLTSLNDWSKDKQFVKLQSIAKDQEVSAIRGKHNSFQTINGWDLVVGDVISLDAGDKVPADCLIITQTNVEVADKQVDSFLLADTFITKGACRALVTCVGKNSTRKQTDDLDTTGSTSLQQKLFNLSKTFTFIGIIAAAIFLITSIIILCMQTGINEEVGGTIFFERLTANITLAVIIIIVAIPEGLPMTVTISLAYSVIRMYKQDKILVRDLNGPERMGQVTDLCCGKTGTLTTEEMTVENFFFQNNERLNSRKNTFLNCYLQDSIVNLVIESIVYNNRAHIEMTDNAFYFPKGNGTDVSMLKWLQDAEIPIHEYVQQKHDIIVAAVPFDPNNKREIVVIRHPEQEQNYRVLIKGAPEIVLEKCN